MVDELERCLHPELTRHFVNLFLEIQKSNQLIMFTHETHIMDLDLLRKDEIWFVDKKDDNASYLYSLDEFKERKDRKVSKAYFEGRYGSLPTFNINKLWEDK